MYYFYPYSYITIVGDLYIYLIDTSYTYLLIPLLVTIWYYKYLDTLYTCILKYTIYYLLVTPGIDYHMT